MLASWRMAWGNSSTIPVKNWGRTFGTIWCRAIQSLLFHSFWAIVVFAALLLTMFIKLFLYYEDKVEALEKRIALIEKGTPEDTGKEKVEKEMPEQEKQAEETENREENYETAGVDGQPYRD